MRRAVAAEWGKVWSLRAPWFCVLAAVVLTAGTAFTLANDFIYDIQEHDRPATDTLAVLDALGPAVQLGQLALVALAVLMVTSEYGTGVIRATLLARPRRGDVLLAKTAVALMIGIVAGAVSAAAGWWVTDFALGTHAVAGSPVAGCLRLAVTVALACAFTSAVGFALRSSAGTLTTAFVILVGLNVLDNRVGVYTPAGSAVAFASGDSAQYPYWVGLVVLTVWVVAAHIAAYILLTRRDA